MKQILAAFLFMLWCAPLLTFAADWQPCYGGLLRCDESGIIWEIATPEASSSMAQLGTNDDLFDFFRLLGLFLNDAVIPLLFGLALLFFLFNVARYFIIESTNTDKREEARRAATYGILAFVLLVSIWGIVNVLVNGLGFDREQSLCPDYLQGWCGNLSRDTFDSGATFGNPSGVPVIVGGSGGNSGGRSGGGSTGSGSSGGGGISLPGGGGSSAGPQSKLVELLYGSLRDNASFNFVSGLPRAATNVVDIPANTTCEAGLAALQTAARFEDTQASYVLYKDSGVERFQNLTDQTTLSSITIDADTLAGTGGSDPVIIHTHPSQTVNELQLSMTGQGPSVADMELLCASPATNATLLIVDEAQVWEVTKTAGTCPRTTRERDDLIVIDALVQLSLMDGTAREAEFTALLEDPNVPDALQNRMQSLYGNTTVGTMTKTEVLGLADSLARNGNMQISSRSVNSFCASY